MATFTIAGVNKEAGQIMVSGSFFDDVAGTWPDMVIFTKEEVSWCSSQAQFRDMYALPRLRERYAAYMDSFNKMKVAADYMTGKIGQAISL